MKLPVQLLLVFVSAGGLPLCFPPLGWWPLVFVSFPALLAATTRTTARRAFYLGLLQGTAGYGIALSWLTRLFGIPAILLFAIMGLFTGLFCLLCNFFTRQTRSAFLRVLGAATLWTAIEFYRSELFFLRFPWITPGSALGPTFLSPIFGVYAASFLIVAASAGFLQRRTVPMAALLSLCVVGLGLFRPGRLEPDERTGLTVTLVQAEECSLRTYLALTRTARKDNPDLIVWPEYALPYDVRKQPGDMAALTNLCAELDALLVVGTQTSAGPGNEGWHNTALVLDRTGVLGEYYKTRPVHFCDDGIPGRDFRPIRTGLGAFATPICFDCDYSSVARRMVALGAQYFVVPSCDPEYWSAKQHLQHAALFRLRAAENARWLACGATSGVSQIIDPHGHVHGRLPLMEQGVLTARIGRSDRLTVFTRVGWLFPWLTLGGSAVLFAGIGVRWTARRRVGQGDKHAHDTGQDGIHKS